MFFSLKYFAQEEGVRFFSWGFFSVFCFTIFFSGGGYEIFIKSFLRKNILLRRYWSDNFAQEEGVRRRVGSISLAGITGPEELELLEEEAHCESEVFFFFELFLLSYFDIWPSLRV